MPFRHVTRKRKKCVYSRTASSFLVRLNCSFIPKQRNTQAHPEIAQIGEYFARPRIHCEFLSVSKCSRLVLQDGVDLPPQIGFDIEEEDSLPTPKASFMSDQNGADIVRQFLEQYYIIYDSDSRQPLLAAYHEQATFSMTCTYSTNPAYK